MSMWKSREGAGIDRPLQEGRANISLELLHGTLLNSRWGEDMATFLTEFTYFELYDLIMMKTV